MITFCKFKLSGFNSVADLIFDFRKPGWNIITGENGSGKTTLFSGLCWTVFGKTLKNKNTALTWKHLRTKSYKGVIGDITIQCNGKKIQIIRCEDYKGKIGNVIGKNNLFIFVDGEEVTQLSDKRAKQKYIESLLGISHNLFVNSIVFGQKMKRFIEETGVNQKNIFDEIFSTEFLNKVRDKVKSDLDDLLGITVKIEDTVENKETELTNTREIYHDLKETENLFEKVKAGKIQELEDEISKLMGKIKLNRVLEKRLKKITNLLTGENDTVNKIIQYQINISNLKQLIREDKQRYSRIMFDINDLKPELLNLKNLLHTKINLCVYCGNEIDKQRGVTQRKKIKKDHENLRKKIQGFETRLVEIDNGLKVLESKLSRKEKTLTVLNSKLVSIKKLEAKKKDLEYNLKDINAFRLLVKRLEQEKTNWIEKTQVIKSTTYLPKIKTLKNHLKMIKADLKHKREKVNLLEWLIKNPLSNTGLKAFIFDSLIDDINDHLIKYSSVLGFQVKFGIKESARKDFYIEVLKKNNTIPYDDLSGGQQQLINVAIAFALHDILSKNIECNILVMDEVFENLDNVRTEKITELIYNKVKGNISLFLITHKEDYNPTNVKSISVVLENGFSKYNT